MNFASPQQSYTSGPGGTSFDSTGEPTATDARSKQRSEASCLPSLNEASFKIRNNISDLYQMFALGKNVVIRIFPSALPSPVVDDGFQARFIQDNREAASCSKSEAQREVIESLSQSKVKR